MGQQLDAWGKQMKSRSDENAFYMWVAHGEHAQTITRTHFAGRSGHLVKIGITSQRLGQKRIHHVAKRYGFKADIRVLIKHATAKHLESRILEFGQFVPGILGDGATEFRFMSESEFQEAIRIAKEAQRERLQQQARPQYRTGPLPTFNWESHSRRMRAKRETAFRSEPMWIDPDPVRMGSANKKGSVFPAGHFQDPHVRLWGGIFAAVAATPILIFSIAKLF